MNYEFDPRNIGDNKAAKLYVQTLIEDRARLELEFEKWRKSQIPPAKNSVQAFVVFLRQNDLWDDDKVHIWCREREENE